MMFRRMVDQVLDLVDFGNVDLERSFIVASGKGRAVAPPSPLLAPVMPTIFPSIPCVMMRFLSE
jgi:hypothetical protein